MLDDTLYIGIAKDLQKRQSKHHESVKGAKYTHNHRPVSLLLYSETSEDGSSASKREYEIKRCEAKINSHCSNSKK